MHGEALGEHHAQHARREGERAAREVLARRLEAIAHDGLVVVLAQIRELHLPDRRISGSRVESVRKRKAGWRAEEGLP